MWPHATLAVIGPRKKEKESMFSALFLCIIRAFYFKAFLIFFILKLQLLNNQFLILKKN